MIQDSAKARDEPSGRSMEIINVQGCQLAYTVSGSGPPLVMIQGVAAQGITPNPQVEALSRRFTCLAFDNRGMGASQPMAVPLSVERMAADALALIDHLGWDSAHIVGHSLGGLIGLELALMERPRVRSLSLLCSFARGADATQMTPALLWILFRLRLGTYHIRRRAFVELVLPPGEEHVDVEALADRFSAIVGHDVADAPAVAKHQVAAMVQHDATPRLPELSGIPTLVINGEKDVTARPASGRAIAAGIAGSRYLEIPGASHAFPILEAERCAALVLEHLEEAEGRWQGNVEAARSSVCSAVVDER